MPYLSLTPELTDSYDERTSLTGYRMMFSILGSLAAFTLPLLLIGSFRPENAERVLTMGIIFGLVSAVPMLLAFFGTREREEFMRQETPKLFSSLKSVIKTRVFLYGLGLFLFTWLTIEVIQATLIYYLKYCVGREGESDIIMASIFVTAVIALPLWQKLSVIWSKRTAFIVGISFWAGVQLVIMLLTPQTPLSFLIVCCVLAGIGVSAAHVLPWAILPDAIEWDEWHSGKRHEGVYYSLITLIQKVAVSVSIPLTLLLLEAAEYRANAVVQSPQAVLVIRLLTGPVPAVLLGIAVLFAVLYPLDRKKHAAIVKELEIRRRAGASE
jgi:GPH family glycoside/pentoside/hexuronide:cation symporter